MIDDFDELTGGCRFSSSYSCTDFFVFSFTKENQFSRDSAKRPMHWTLCIFILSKSCEFFIVLVLCTSDVTLHCSLRSLCSAVFIHRHTETTAHDVLRSGRGCDLLRRLLEWGRGPRGGRPWILLEEAVSDHVFIFCVCCAL